MNLEDLTVVTLWQPDRSSCVIKEELPVINHTYQNGLYDELAYAWNFVKW